MSVLVNVIVMLGMLVIVPAGLRLMDAAELASIRRIWPVFAVPGAVALWLPRSTTAAVLAGVYALGTLALAAQAPRRLGRVSEVAPSARRAGPAASGACKRKAEDRPRTGRTWATPTTPRVRVPGVAGWGHLPGEALGELLRKHAPAHTRSLAPAEVAQLTALVTPSVAGLALVAERAGYGLFGFGLTVLALTVPHFHFAGFTAALVAGLVCRTTAGAAGRFAALSVPLGTLLVLAGYFLDDWAELLGALVLTAGMWTVALLTWRDVRAGGRDRFTRTLLAVSAAVLVATMLLALSWALGEATGLPHPNLTWMAATHGLGNALGFALCSVLAWRRLKETTA
ncbi:YndJ family protein [Streptomyces sp. NBC_00191]